MNDSSFTRKASFVPSFPLKSQGLASRLKPRSTPRSRFPSFALRPKAAPSPLPPDSFLSERSRGKGLEASRDSPQAPGLYSTRDTPPTPSPTRLLPQPISPVPYSQQQDSFMREFASTPLSLPRLRRRAEAYSPGPYESPTPELGKIKAFVVVPRPVVLGSADSSRPGTSPKPEECEKLEEVGRRRKAKAQQAIFSHPSPYKTEAPLSSPLSHLVPNLLSLLAKDTGNFSPQRPQRQLRKLVPLSTARGEISLGKGSVGLRITDKN